MESQALKLGRYEVIRELGKGAMGIVYLARDPLIGRMVALKTIRTSQSPDDEVKEFQERFVREAQAAGVLSHPAIVTVHDIGEDSATGTSFIAMEYVEGPNLKEILNQGTVLPFEHIASVISQVAAALDFAHARGIVHRDVKPANIIWCGEAKVKITDFGIAKIASSVANLTSTGQFLGTPNYMAPEQIKGASVDGRSDLFSLGIVLYEMLTRKKPFGGDSLTTISYRIVHEPFPKLREFNPAIPVEFDEILERCLSKDPKDRYQRGLEMARALDNVVRATKGLPGLEPLIEDATVLTREDIDPETITTVEIPRDQVPPQPKKNAPADRFSNTMRRKVPRRFFFGVLIGLLTLVGLSAAAIWSGRAPVKPVDTNREDLVARQRRLRDEGNRLSAAGNVEGAYAKYLELSRIAPNSPEVQATLAKLGATLGDRTSERQRLASSLERIDAGKQLMEKKDFAAAKTAFEQALQLDPTSQEATNQIRIAILEKQQQDAGTREKLVLGNKPISAAAKTIPGLTPKSGPEGGRSGFKTTSLNIVIQSPVAEGYIIVKLDGQTLLHEYLFENRGRGIFQRKTPRTIRVTTEVKAKSSELQVWVVIPGWMATPTIVRHTFRPGVSETLTIVADKGSKRFVPIFS